MLLTLIAALLAAGLFLGMLLFLEVGRRIGTAQATRNPDGLAKGIGAAEAAVFGLLGLIIAFSFSGAASRFEDRRHLITQEANAIGTAWLRLDLLPTDAQPGIRQLFRQYAEIRASVYSDIGDAAGTKSKIDGTERLQKDIWAGTLAAGRRPDTQGHAMMLLVPALNDMIDITTTRTAATQNHPPSVIFILLAGLSLIGSLLVGYSMSANRHRSWLHTIAFAVVMSLAAYVIVDLEFPRMGLIRIGGADQILIDLRNSMN